MQKPFLHVSLFFNIWHNQISKVFAFTSFSLFLQTLCKLLDKIGVNLRPKLFGNVYEPFGGNLRQIVCGGAPLNPEVVKGMKDLGIYISNGYGITECGPLISMNADTFKDPYSVGKACPGLEAKLINVDEDGVGELCVRGKSVSSGYYKDEEATKAVFMASTCRTRFPALCST